SKEHALVVQSDTPVSAHHLVEKAAAYSKASVHYVSHPNMVQAYIRQHGGVDDLKDEGIWVVVDMTFDREGTLVSQMFDSLMSSTHITVMPKFVFVFSELPVHNAFQVPTLVINDGLLDPSKACAAMLHTSTGVSPDTTSSDRAEFFVGMLARFCEIVLQGLDASLLDSEGQFLHALILWTLAERGICTLRPASLSINTEEKTVFEVSIPQPSEGIYSLPNVHSAITVKMSDRALGLLGKGSQHGPMVALFMEAFCVVYSSFAVLASLQSDYSSVIYTTMADITTRLGALNQLRDSVIVSDEALKAMFPEDFEPAPFGIICYDPEGDTVRSTRLRDPIVPQDFLMTHPRWNLPPSLTDTNRGFAHGIAACLTFGVHCVLNSHECVGKTWVSQCAAMLLPAFVQCVNEIVSADHTDMVTAYNRASAQDTLADIEAEAEARIPWITSSLSDITGLRPTLTQHIATLKGSGGLSPLACSDALDPSDPLRIPLARLEYLSTDVDMVQDGLETQRELFTAIVEDCRGVAGRLAAAANGIESGQSPREHSLYMLTPPPQPTPHPSNGQALRYGDEGEAAGVAVVVSPGLVDIRRPQAADTPEICIEAETERATGSEYLLDASDTPTRVVPRLRPVTDRDRDRLSTLSGPAAATPSKPLAKLRQALVMAQADLEETARGGSLERVTAPKAGVEAPTHAKGERDTEANRQEEVERVARSLSLGRMLEVGGEVAPAKEEAKAQTRDHKYQETQAQEMSPVSAVMERREREREREMERERGRRSLSLTRQAPQIAMPQGEGGAPVSILSMQAMGQIPMEEGGAVDSSGLDRVQSTESLAGIRERERERQRQQEETVARGANLTLTRRVSTLSDQGQARDKEILRLRGMVDETQKDREAERARHRNLVTELNARSDQLSQTLSATTQQLSKVQSELSALKDKERQRKDLVERDDRRVVDAEALAQSAVQEREDAVKGMERAERERQAAVEAAERERDSALQRLSDGEGERQYLLAALDQAKEDHELYVQEASASMGSLEEAIRQIEEERERERQDAAGTRTREQVDREREREAEAEKHRTAVSAAVDAATLALGVQHEEALSSLRAEREREREQWEREREAERAEVEAERQRERAAADEERVSIVSTLATETEVVSQLRERERQREREQEEREAETQREVADLRQRLEESVREAVQLRETLEEREKVTQEEREREAAQLKETLDQMEREREQERERHALERQTLQEERERDAEEAQADKQRLIAAHTAREAEREREWEAERAMFESAVEDERQARERERSEMREEGLRELDILRKFRERDASVQFEMAALTQSLAQAQARIVERETALTAMGETLEEAEGYLSELRAQVSTLQEASREAEAAHAAQVAETHAAHTLEMREAEEGARTRMESAQREWQEERERLSEGERQAREAEAMLRADLEKAGQTQIETEGLLGEARDRADAALSEVCAMSQALDAATDEIASLTAARASLSSECDTLHNTLAETEVERERQREAEAEETAEREAQLERLEVELADGERERERLQRERDRVERERDAIIEERDGAVEALAQTEAEGERERERLAAEATIQARERDRLHMQIRALEAEREKVSLARELEEEERQREREQMATQPCLDASVLDLDASVLLGEGEGEGEASLEAQLREKVTVQLSLEQDLADMRETTATLQSEVAFLRGEVDAFRAGRDRERERERSVSRRRESLSPQSLAVPVRRSASKERARERERVARSVRSASPAPIVPSIPSVPIASSRGEGSAPARTASVSVSPGISMSALSATTGTVNRRESGGERERDSSRARPLQGIRRLLPHEDIAHYIQRQRHALVTSRRSSYTQRSASAGRGRQEE
ncbi:hypothetical protein KIPB_004713, partial [Kipferlia bialata]